MKRKALYILGLMLFPLAACEFHQPVEEPEMELEGIVLTLQCQDEVVTKTGADGIKEGTTAWNENKIAWADVYFYHYGETDTNAEKHVRFLPNRDNTVTLPVNVTDADVENIAPRATGDNYWVYVIANFPDTTALNGLTDTSIDNLKAQVLNTDFVTDHKQPHFVMDGLSIGRMTSRSRRSGSLSSTG